MGEGLGKTGMEKAGGVRPEDQEKYAQIYLDDLCLSWDDLMGKKVLDMGAGSSEFGIVAKRHGIEVTSLDSMDAASWEQDLSRAPKEANFVVGRAGLLPFVDNSFDIVISHAAPPTIMTYDKGSVAAVIREAKRVLKIGGEFRFGVGNLRPAVFGEEEEPMAALQEEGSDEEKKTKRMRAKSIELLKAVDQSIEEIENHNPKRFRVSHDWYHYYSLKKGDGDSPRA